MAPIFLALAKLAPMLLDFAGKPGAAQVTQKAVEIAQAVTGTDNPESAVDALKASPDAVLAYEKALLDSRLELEKLSVERERIAAGDRDSARKREIETKDPTPARLALAVTLGFFGVLGYLLVAGKPAAGGDALLVMLGSLGTAWTAIISYYYGSSSSSAQKTELLARK